MSINKNQTIQTTPHFAVYSNRGVYIKVEVDGNKLKRGTWPDTFLLPHNPKSKISIWELFEQRAGFEIDFGLYALVEKGEAPGFVAAFQGITDSSYVAVSIMVSNPRNDNPHIDNIGTDEYLLEAYSEVMRTKTLYMSEEYLPNPKRDKAIKRDCKKNKIPYSAAGPFEFFVYFNVKTLGKLESQLNLFTKQFDVIVTNKILKGKNKQKKQKVK
ncbi:MAG: hypothetical protein KF721_15705 [Ignavibacteriaceae bacterium]|nr:hypothetical protein [Ignavibacteriaceae bacterium]